MLIEAILCFAVQYRRDLDVLVVIHLKARSRRGVLDLPGLECLSHSDDTGVELAGAIEVRDSYRDIRHASDRWPLRNGLRISFGRECGEGEKSGADLQRKTSRPDIHPLSGRPA